MDLMPFDEKCLSQIPALRLLGAMGYGVLSPERAREARGGRTGSVLLERILVDQLKTLNHIQYKGESYRFSEENIQSAVQSLKSVKFDGLLRTNEVMYDLLTLGTSLEQRIEGDAKSFNLKYIDWEHWDRNVFHVTAEFPVGRSRSHEADVPDIVLFVNGIPLGVIECKAPSEEVEKAVEQSVRNQGEAHIPKLFVTAQILLGINKNAARYGTVGTPKKFWAVWKVPTSLRSAADEKRLRELCQSTEADEVIFMGRFAAARPFFERMRREGERAVTEQDRALFELCRPERLLELAHRFTLFDGGIKKIARYQQYYVIQSTLKRIQSVDPEGRRRGGIIWHTQGSGKSLTMVMLARNLALDPNPATRILNPRIVLVTDRDDLDRQLGNTFAACGLNPERATSGKDLLKLVSERKAAIVTTIINKFDKALNVKKVQEDSQDVFVLVDESHRTNFGSFAARMRQMFPRGCYIGFTGTPLLKEEKNNFAKFGKLIEPAYPIDQAVKDGAVVELRYEGRMVEMEQNKEAMDRWFERYTLGLTLAQKADLKKKYARAEVLNRAEQVVYMRAFDISEHFRQSWQGTGFKAQLVAPTRAVAIRYHEVLREIGHVSSEVMMSAPDMRESQEEVDEEPTDVVVRFWQKMMKRFGNEEEYTKQVVNQFKFGSEPEILIVVSKLLTGFDAPKNRVIYLCRELRDHTLLQAIARVNRLEEGKDYGCVVDYVGLLGSLDKAMNLYSALEGFDAEDLAGALQPMRAEVDKLPQRHADLLDLFKTVKNRYDEEAFEQLLADEALRDRFYDRLNAFAKNLALALSTEHFVRTVSDEDLARYKGTLSRFLKLKASVKLRYGEAVDYRDHDAKIQKMIDTHLQAHEVTQLNEPVNIFDEKAFQLVKEGQGVYETKSTASRADTIAHRTKKVVTERMGEDPAFYARISQMIQEAIDAFRARRLSDIEYLNKVSGFEEQVRTRRHENVPAGLEGHEDAQAYFGVANELLGSMAENGEEIAADLALAVENIFQRFWKVHFWGDEEAKKTVVDAIDDYLFDEVMAERGLSLDSDQLDALIEQLMTVARHRRPE
ncbi:MAG: type I restriction endonuclease subunit R [Verrucomicrobia bacterium]|nr:type I restriction endonuclease subunit R [Verrucomicrobiota bacterium]